jgi:release factor glutamine methyltransferase
MLPTPSTTHVCFDRVYEPAEDSFLILDTLSSASEKSFLAEQFKSPQAAKNDVKSAPPLILEVGTGSGVVLAFLHANADTIFGRSDILTIGTDINSFASKSARQTILTAEQDTSQPLDGAIRPHRMRGHGIFLDILNADLAQSFRSGVVDVIVFNPPYVPAELPDLDKHEVYNMPDPRTNVTSFEQDSHLLELSYAGGVDGMEITDKFLEDLPRLLHPSRGVAYLLLCAQNKPELVKQRVRDWGPDWAVETAGSSGKKAGWEKLQVLRIWRPNPPGS